MLTVPAGPSPAEPIESREETIVRTMSLKQTAVAGAAALAMVGAALGVAGAQQAPTASPSPTVPAPAGSSTQPPPAANPGPGSRAPGGQQRQEQFLNALAAKLNVSPDRLRQAMEQTRTELGLPDRAAGGFGRPGGGRFGASLDAAARAIGISVEQLRQELRGSTLADVARAHNVNPTTVANALKAEANTRIDQAAAAGRIPSDQVAQAKQRAAEQIDRKMTQQVPAGPPPAGGSSR